MIRKRQARGLCPRAVPLEATRQTYRLTSTGSIPKTGELSPAAKQANVFKDG